MAKIEKNKKNKTAQNESGFAMRPRIEHGNRPPKIDPERDWILKKEELQPNLDSHLFAPLIRTNW